MTLEKNQVISAQAILRSASLKVLDADTVITSENIGDYAPTLEDVAKVSKVLIDMGFDVAELVGISFSVSAPVSTFEEMFKAKLLQEEDGGIKVVRADGSLSYEFPLIALPESIADLVVVLTFTPPPDFGPTEFFET